MEKNKKYLEKFLLEGAKSLNLVLSDDVLIKMDIYASLLEKWNKAYSLISGLSDLEDIGKHILDSLTVTAYIRGPLILDVGTGAGFPGLPLAFILPKYQFVLLDSRNKKIRFLNQALLMTALPNVKVIEKRVEKFQPEQCFATIISRATYSLSEMVIKIQHLICRDGQLLMMKGKYPNDELNELKLKFPHYTVKVYKLKTFILNGNGSSGLAPGRPEQFGNYARRQGDREGSVLNIHDRSDRRCQQSGKPKCEGYRVNVDRHLICITGIKSD